MFLRLVCAKSVNKEIVEWLYRDLCVAPEAGIKVETIVSVLVLLSPGIVRPAYRDWACQTERCHTLSNKTSLQ